MNWDYVIVAVIGVWLVATVIWFIRQMRRGWIQAYPLDPSKLRGEIREAHIENDGDESVVWVAGNLELLMPDGTWIPATQARWNAAARQWVSVEN